MKRSHILQDHTKPCVWEVLYLRSTLNDKHERSPGSTGEIFNKVNLLYSLLNVFTR